LGEAPSPRRQDRQGIGLDRRGIPRAVLTQPVMMEVDAPKRQSMRPEWMDVAFARPSEVSELDPKFIRGASRPHEFGLVETDPGDERAQMRQGRLTDADDADLGGFDEPDVDRAAEEAGKRRGGHPSRGASA